MKFGRLIVFLAGFLGTLLPYQVGAQSLRPNGKLNTAGAPSAAQQKQNIQFVVEWLTSRNIMDPVSALELALSLTETELNKLVQALQNPLIQINDKDIVPV